jgi:hypothetical protein
MPNGGSDCCGTCWFNARNEGRAGYPGSRSSAKPAFCTIRGLEIDDPFWTYCGNHPHRRPEPDPIPIGPVYVAGSSDQLFDYTRKVWRPSPDTEEIRVHLLTLLAQIAERPASEYPLGTFLDELVVWQLGEFQESRATSELNRIATFDPESAERGPFGRTREGLVRLAQEALAKIAPTLRILD